MSVIVLEPGRRVRVAPDDPDVKDVLEYARALIEAYGWNQGKGAIQSSPETGYTLHDAIGASCTKLSSIVQSEHSGYERSGSKDWVSTKVNGDAENLRAGATDAVAKHLPDGVQNDTEFNDNATDVQQIFDVLDRALAEV